MEPKIPSLGRLQKFMGYVMKEPALSAKIQATDSIQVQSKARGPTMIPRQIAQMAEAFEKSGNDIYVSKSKDIVLFAATYLEHPGEASNGSSTVAVADSTTAEPAVKKSKKDVRFDTNIAVVSLLMAIEPVAKMDRHPGAEARISKVNALLDEYREHCDFSST